MYPYLSSTLLRIGDIIFGFGLLLTAISCFFIGIYLMRGLTYADPSTGIAPLVRVFTLLDWA